MGQQLIPSELLDDRRIVMRPVTELKPARRQARTHSQKQIRQIANSIETFGFVNPVLVEADGRVIAGHGRVLAALLVGLESIPTRWSPISVRRRSEPM